MMLSSTTNTLGKGEVESSILSHSTIKTPIYQQVMGQPLRFEKAA